MSGLSTLFGVMGMGPSELSALLTSLKTLNDMAQSIKDVHDDIARQEKVIEFQSKLTEALSKGIGAQEERAQMLQIVGELERELQVLKSWEEDKKRYELTQVGDALVFRIKEDARGTEPPHCICPRCYHEKHKSILQPEVHFPGRNNVLVCPKCGVDFLVDGNRDVAEMALRPRRKG